MTVKVIVNNYQMGSKVKMTPMHKITSRDRIDKSHTELIYTNITQREKEFIEKVLAKKSIIID